jgi:transcriptional regulator with XRE-family HTH domain
MADESNENLRRGSSSRSTHSIVKGLRRDLDISQQQLAALLQVSIRTVSRWECGAVEPDGDLRRRIVRLREIIDKRLRIDRDPESVIAWLTTPQLITCIPIDLLYSARAVAELTKSVKS